MALRDGVAIALVLAQSACSGGCGGDSLRGNGSSAAPVASMVKVMSRGTGGLPGIDSAALGFDKLGTVATDGVVALVDVLDGFVRIPLGRDEPALRLQSGRVYDPIVPMSTQRVAAQPGAAVRVTDAAGAHTLELPGALTGMALAPLADGGLVRITQEANDTVIAVQRYGADGVLAHEARLPAPSASTVPIAAAAHGDITVVVLDDRKTIELWGLAVADAAVRWRKTVASRYTYGFTVTGTGSFVITMEDPATCEACSRAEVRQLADGELAHSVRMQTAWQRGHTLGATDTVIWAFHYLPRGSDHMLGTHHEAKLDYAVFSATRDTGAPLRTLADATGEWRALTDGARVHALVPAPGGRVLAIYVPSFDRAEAVLLSGPP